MPDDNANAGKDEPGGYGGAGGEAGDDPISTAETIDQLLAASADTAKKSFDAHIALGQKAMRRLVDPDSETGSIAEDAQAAMGLVLRDAMLAVNTWSRLVYLSSKQDE